WLIIIFLAMSFVMTVAYCIFHGFDMDDRAIIASSLAGMLLIYVISCFVNPVISAMNAMKVPFLLIFLLPGYCFFGNIFAEDSRIVSIISRIMEILIVSISALSAFLFGFYAV
ncbi:MAG: hypothetical protein KBS83_06410, partial [Lachnospiraceae bacterium]|nr:hypothetical protein [Candidatus Equihabitans merdae]